MIVIQAYKRFQKELFLSNKEIVIVLDSLHFALRELLKEKEGYSSKLVY